jgi:membrane complex biogenesis BtpA family protein
MSARIGRNLFGAERPLIGVIHLEPLPGSPRWRPPLEPVVARACEEAHVLDAGGLDGLIVENFGDVPFLPGAVGPETVAAMAVAASEVVRAVDIPCGVNVLRSDPVAALGIAVATGARFLRVNVHVGATVTDQGVIPGAAAALLRERARLGAEDVAILADVHVKHGRPLAGGDVAEAAQDAVERGLADAVLVTGARTGGGADLAEVRAVKHAVGDRPVLVASGVTPETVAETLDAADGVIVATSLHGPDGRIEPSRVQAFVAAARG